MEEKQKQVTASETRLNQISSEINGIQEAISQANNKRSTAVSRIHDAEDNLKTVQTNLLNSQIKDAVDATVSFYCVFRSIRSRIGIEVRSAIRIHSINRELNFFYRFLTRFFAAFHCRGIFPQGLSLKDHSV
ncbi:hypothetical protein [Shigella sonnei]|nr:hypothetical protein [Shigella sonnei]CSW25412.1 colicin E1 protein [Shigella sonnei]